MSSPSFDRRLVGPSADREDRLDHTPVDGLRTDVGKLAEIGNLMPMKFIGTNGQAKIIDINVTARVRGGTEGGLFVVNAVEDGFRRSVVNALGPFNGTAQWPAGPSR